MLRSAFASLCIMIAMGHAANATIGCQVVALDAKDASAGLYQAPDGSAPILSRIPLGDIVFYPDNDLAPRQAQGWVWVRHDSTQQDIWNNGVYGWMRVETIDICG